MQASWILLITAGIFEGAWAIGLKYTVGFTKIVPSILTITAMVISMYLLALATKNLPLSTAYTVWVGMGVLAANLAGLVLFGESFSPAKLFLLSLLTISIIGLKIISD